MKDVRVKTNGSEVEGLVYVGSTQDSINRAINYVSSQGGGRVFIEAGNYLIRLPISMKSNVEICGERFKTILQNDLPTLGFNNSGVIEAVGTIDSIITDININNLFIGNVGNSQTGTNAIYLKYVGNKVSAGLDGVGITYSHYDESNNGGVIQYQSGAIIKNCTFNNNGTTGVLAVDTFNSNFYDNNFQNNGNAIRLSQSGRCIISRNIIRNNQSVGVYVSNSRYITITKNNISQCNTSGIVVEGDSVYRENSITSNIVQNNIGDGIRVNSYNTLVNGNVVQNNSENGININNTMHCTVIDNTVQNNGLVGISITTCSHNNICSNVVQHNFSHGISAISSSHRNNINGNAVQNNGGSTGINIDSSSYNTVTGNRMSKLTNSNSSGNITSPNIPVS